MGVAVLDELVVVMAMTARAGAALSAHLVGEEQRRGVHHEREQCREAEGDGGVPGAPAERDGKESYHHRENDPRCRSLEVLQELLVNC